MSGAHERPGRAWARALVDAESGGSRARALDDLCLVLAREVTAEVMVSVMTEAGPSLVAASPRPHGAPLGPLQATAGEGPAYDAQLTRRPVLVGDLRGDGGRRWPGFADAALRSGVQAVYAFPLAVGAVVTGVLELYRDGPGRLERTETTIALTFAEVATEYLLDQQAVKGGSAAAHGIIDAQVQVYQAQGMVMASLGVPIDEALARMRAHAFTHDVQLDEVARDIVSGRLRLEPDP